MTNATNAAATNATNAAADKAADTAADKRKAAAAKAAATRKAKAAAKAAADKAAADKAAADKAAADKAAADNAKATPDASAQVHELAAAVMAQEQAGRRTVDAVLAFRDLETDEKTIGTWIVEAYVEAGYDAKSSSVTNAKSCALALWRAPTIPADLPVSLQNAAKLVRSLPDYQAMSAKSGRRGTGKRKAPAAGKAGKAGDAPSASAGKLTTAEIRDALRGTLNGLKDRAKDREALELIGDLLDVLDTE